MATNNPRISKSGVTTTGRFPLFSNSPEVQDADPSLVRFVRGNSLSALYLSNGNLGAEDIEIVAEEVTDGDGSNGNTGDGVFRGGVPNSSDISIVSNTVVLVKTPVFATGLYSNDTKMDVFKREQYPCKLPIAVGFELMYILLYF